VDQILRSFSGARVRRVIDRSGGRAPEHAHDWPLLSIFVIGGYENRTELGRAVVAGPSLVLYRPGAAHENLAGAAGFEQIEIEFDPAWLGDAPWPDLPVSRWIGGAAGGRARMLARVCAGAEEATVRLALRRFFAEATGAERPAPPAWAARIEQRLRADPGLKAAELAAEAGRHPAWLGQGYRRVMGEGPAEAAARFRVERAARLLRETDEPAAGIAAEAGFCDQSHMARTFRRLLGRTPGAVRADRPWMRAAAA
jgi:AraC-like DNA-binding protein